MKEKETSFIEALMGFAIIIILFLISARIEHVINY